MDAGADAAVVELAECVQALIREAFAARPWVQLVGLLSPAERESLGGGEDRPLASRLSAQFGAKARRGPSAATIVVVLRHCLPLITDRGQHEQRRAQVLECFRAVHGPDAALAPPPARARRGGVGLQLQQQRDENAALHGELDRMRGQNNALQAELKGVKARLAVLEAERATTALAALRTVGIRQQRADESSSRPNLVRPYTRAHEQGPRGTPARPTGPDDPAPPPDPPDPLAGTDAADHGTETPTAAMLTNAYRIANTPRSFTPLPQYRPGLQSTAPALPLRVPHQRVVARVAMPPGIKVPVPREGLSGVVAWGLVPTSPPCEPGETAVITDPGIAVQAAQRRRARVEAIRLVAELRMAWADPWADLASDQMPDNDRGWAQIPLLAVTFVLAALISTVPALLA